MKLLLHKKWCRIAAITVVTAGVSLAVAIAIANRRGAEELQRALTEARAAGVPVTRPDICSDMPSPERNAALHGILKEWEDAMAKPSAPGSDDRLTSLRAFASPQWSHPWVQPKRPPGQKYRTKRIPQLVGPPIPVLPKGSADFRLMKRSDGYGQNPSNFLTQFGHRHGATLHRLQQDLIALPELRRPLADESPLVTDLVHDRLTSLGNNIHAALALRAEAELQTGRPDLAADSILLSLGLARALGSRGPDGISAISYAFRSVAKPLRAGITRHQWKEENLARIAAELGSLDLKAVIQRDVAAVLLMLSLWERWKEDRHDFKNQAHLAFEITDIRPIQYEVVRTGGGYLLPRGWFDWNAADLLRTTGECRRIAISSSTLNSWIEGAERLRKDYFLASTKKHHLIISYPIAADSLTIGARAIVLRDLMVAACMIEQSYLTRRLYPEKLPSGVPDDPRFARPFAYLLKPGDGFEVYSVGSNGEDDSARSAGKRREGDDFWW